jgi:hypothetical protein
MPKKGGPRAALSIGESEPRSIDLVDHDAALQARGHGSHRDGKTIGS